MDWRRALNGPSARAARLVGLGLGAVLAAAISAYLLLPVVVRGLTQALTLALNGSVWIAASLSSGMDAWTIVTTIGRTAGSALITPRASTAIGVLVLVAGVALYGLQRLLGSGEESSS